VKPDDVTEHCLAMVGVAEDFPFGEQPAVYRVGGKVFALLSEGGDPARISLKLPPFDVTTLRTLYPETVLQAA
jgi:predicted DNA-binding protein (MmcQ/YjbR family)